MDTVRKAVAEQRAEELIATLGISDLTEINVEDIAMTQGALVLEGGLTGAEARLTSSPKLSFIRVNSSIREPGRKRFGIAHEIGHIVLHKERSPLEICTHNNLVLFHSNEEKEVDANCFAAALLMPRTMFESQCRSAFPSLDLVSQLAEKFQVTLTATGMRYIEFCPHRCCVVVSTRGRIRYHRRTSDFGYFLHPSEELRPSTYAADLFAGTPIAPGMRSVPAEAWLEGSRIDGAKRILEHSIPMPTYDSVFTLLWIDKDIDKYVTGDDEADAEQEASDSRWSWNRYRRDET
ncbi:MAG: ImmA/IrrE family metallo-endopeptidase [Candidatus Acidiferrales bacterium]